MPKVKLDAAFCLAAVCEPGKRKTDYWCTHTIGHVLECRSSGGRTHYLRYLDRSGRQRQHKIGGVNDITFDQARKAARRLRSEVVLGGDPLADRQDKRAVINYAALSVMHLDHAKTRMRSYDSLETIIRLHLLPRWGRLRLDEITPQAVAKWLGEKTDEGLAPATVEKIRVMFGRSFELARQWSLPGGDKNPVRGVRGPRFDNGRQRYLSAEEVGRLLEAAGKSLSVQLRPLIALALTTAARLGEIRLARWTDIDIERRSWLIPVAKTKPRYVPLSQAAIDIIQALPRFEGCPWLIPNPETKKPFVSIKRAWQKARRDAGLPGLRIHDLRHSAASFMINSGVDLFAVGKVLGHSDYKSTMRYSHLANDTLLAAVEAGAARMKGNPAL